MDQAFDPKNGTPPIREDMVAFYTSYIPSALRGQPEKIAAAKAVLAARDVRLLGSILKPPPNPSLRSKPQSAGWARTAGRGFGRGDFRHAPEQ